MSEHGYGADEKRTFVHCIYYLLMILHEDIKFEEKKETDIAELQAIIVNNFCFVSSNFKKLYVHCPKITLMLANQINF